MNCCNNCRTFLKTSLMQVMMMGEDEDYEPSKAASDSSSDCDAEDTCRLEEELEDDVQQQVMPAMIVGQAGCST